MKQKRYTAEIINELKIFLKNTNKSDKLLAIIIRKTKIRISNSRNEREDIISDFINIKG